MRIMFLIMLAMFVQPIYADEPAKAPPEKVFTLKVNESELNVLGQLLAKAPYEVAAPILADLQKQVLAQMVVQPPKETKK